MARNIKNTNERVKVFAGSEVFEEKVIVVKTGGILVTYDQKDSKVIILPASEIKKIEISRE